MISLQKIAILAALLAAAVVEADNASPPPIKLTGAEMKLRVEATQKEIAADNKHVLHLQALARKEKDVIKLTCVNDKLVQIKAQMDLFDTASLQLDATINGGEGAADESFNATVQAGADVKRLRGEADGCAGELEMYKQESKTDVQHPDLDDPTNGEPFQDPSQVGDPNVDVPGYATPYS